VDEQWNLWVKLGIRRLVSSDDMPGQMGTTVGQHYNTASPPPGAWHATGPVGSVAILDNSLTASKQSWDVAEDTELDQTGGDLLHSIGWDWMERHHAAPNTPVSPNTQVSDGGFETTDRRQPISID
jgi:hypothetical protein